MPTELSELVVQMKAAQDFELARSAKRQLWQQVRQAGRPGADAERGALATQLTTLMNEDSSTVARRELLWMLSEIGGDDCVAPMAELLQDPELREDARMALERIPGDVSLDALRKGLETVPEEFRLNIAQSLRARGLEVPGLSCVKLKPTKTTQVKRVEED